jgi:hypothetical protein
MARRTPTSARKTTRSAAASNRAAGAKKKSASRAGRATSASKTARKAKGTKKTAKPSRRAETPARKTTRKSSPGATRATSAPGARSQKKTARASRKKTAAVGRKKTAAASRQPTAAGRKKTAAAGRRKTAQTRTPARPRRPAAATPRKRTAPPKTPAAKPAATRGGAGTRGEGRLAQPRRRPGGAAAARPAPPDVGRTPRHVPPTTAEWAADAPERTVLDTEGEEEELVPGAPSSLDLDRRGRAVDLGAAAGSQQESEAAIDPTIRGGDTDIDFQKAYSSGDEAPGGDNPTPDQDVVDLIGRAIGVEYEDNEELKGADKIAERDRHRWELDPASAEDYKDRSKGRAKG